MRMHCVLAALCALLAPASCDIMTFDNTNALTRHFHTQSDTLYSREDSKATRPYISFQVQCPDGRARVSWIVVSTDERGIPKHKSEEVPSVTTDKTFPSPRPPRCGRHNTGNTTKPAGAARRAADTTASPATTTTARDTDDAAGTDTSIGTSSAVNENSNLLYIPERVLYVQGGCIVCVAGEYHAEMITDVIQKSGYYTLWIESWSNDSSYGPRIIGSSTFMNRHGYLSAELYPLLVFFGVGGIVYLVLGIIFLILTIMHFHDVLSLQLWIGAVIFLGMVHMAFAYGDLSYINNNGTRSNFLMVTSELLLAVKNTLSRLLVLIVSMGYGVVKPRLGPVFKQIAAVGLAFFFFDAFYSVTHSIDRTAVDDSSTDAMVVIPLSAIDAGIFYWILASITQTIRILSIRRNEVKLQMYTRFRIILGISIALGIAFIIWLVSDEFMGVLGEEDWYHYWWQESFWHILFFAILLAIVWLWRPTNNNARFAYTPLETLDDDEEPRVNPNYSSESIKMRTLTARGQTPAPKEDVDEDLKWVEENIPSASVRDTSFPVNPMDSDEELMSKRFEASKMD